MAAPGDRKSLIRRFGNYLLDNPVRGLRTPLSGAPRSTWALVPVYTVAALLLGFWSDSFEIAQPTLIRSLTVPIVLVVFPSLIEEFVYRGILLPRALADASPVQRFGAVSASTAVYVAAHPLVPILGVLDSDFFLNPWILVAVGILGYTLGYSYIRSWSLWAPTLIHWATVVVWNLFLKAQP